MSRFLLNFARGPFIGRSRVRPRGLRNMWLDHVFHVAPPPRRPPHHALDPFCPSTPPPHATAPPPPCDNPHNHPLPPTIPCHRASPDQPIEPTLLPCHASPLLLLPRLHPPCSWSHRAPCTHMKLTSTSSN